jgi:hypothetical protein
VDSQPPYDGGCESPRGAAFSAFFQTGLKAYLHEIFVFRLQSSLHLAQ